MTVVVKAASHFGTAYVAAAAEDCSRLVGVCRDLCFFLSLLFLSSSSFPPLLSRVAYSQANQAFAVRFGLSSVCPLSFGSPFIGPHRRLPFFSFMSFCLHVSSSFPSLARAFVRTLACTHTRVRILLTTRFRWPRFVTMRFGGSSVVPLHLVLLHWQPHTLFVSLVFPIFICLLSAHMCFA